MIDYMELAPDKHKYPLIWRELPEFEGSYEVSNWGDVRSLDRDEVYLTKHGCVTRHRSGTLLEQQMSEDGYAVVALSYGGKEFTRKVHRCVYSGFTDNFSLTYVSNRCINHIDGIKTHNYLWNLEEVTVLENNQHASKMGLISKGVDKPNSSVDLDTLASILTALHCNQSATISSIAKDFGLSRSVVTRINGGLTYRELTGKLVSSYPIKARARSPRAKLTESQVVHIKKLLAQRLPHRLIADRSGATRQCVTAINLGLIYG